MMSIGLSDAAGRTAYLAAFHAAQALISERMGRTVKTLKGVHAEFQRLTQQKNNFPVELRSFLSRAYTFKALADYETGPEAELSMEEVTKAVDMAQQFVANITQSLEDAE